MKKLAKGIAVVTGIVGVAAIAVGVYEKLTGKNIVDEAKKFLDKVEEDDFADDFGDFDDSDYDEDDDYSEDYDDSADEEEHKDDSEFKPDDEDEFEEE